MKRHALSPLAALLLLPLTGCGGSSGSAPAPAPTATIKYFEGPGSCSRLEAYIEDTAEAMMRAQLAGLAVDPSGGVLVQVPAPMPAPGSAPAPVPVPVSAPAPTGGPVSEGYSTTNLQIGGVDEPDVIKNDGTHLYSLKTASGQFVLSKIRLAPPDALTLLGQARWATRETAQSPTESARGLFLIDADRVLAITSSADYSGMPINFMPAQPAQSALPPICVDDHCGIPAVRWTPPRTRLRLFSVGGAAAPVETASFELAGRMLGARRIGNRVYLVTASPLEMPSTVGWWPAAQAGADPIDPQQWRRALEALADENAMKIRGGTLTDWLRPLATAAGTPDSPPSDSQCSTFARVDAPTRLGWLRVHTINVDTGEIDHGTILSDGAIVFMGRDSLVVTSPYWSAAPDLGTAGRPDIRPGQSRTLLHRYTLDSAGRARYGASGTIDGSLINSYAIDEAADGTLRLAASDTDATGSFSYLATLRQNGPALTLLGRTAPIAPGERLQSARFLGERAYLVTFRQIDPFFVYDLKDPAAPLELGELKVPGFSTYLHPVGEHHILGIGYDGGGWPRRIKASLFDVSDPSVPREQSVLTLGDSYTGSDALWDPHAFTYLQRRTGAAVMAVPLNSYAATQYGTDNLSGIRLVHVDPALAGNALRDGGTLSLTGQAGESVPAQGRYARRSVIVGEAVHAVADGIVRSALIDDPSRALSTLVVP